MRGSPLIRGFIVIALLLVTAFPLWKLTHRADATMASAPVAPSEQAPVRIQLTFAHPATEFQVMYLGKVIWEERSPGAIALKDFSMEFPKEGVDLEVKAAWAPGAPETAVKVTVTHGYNSIDKTAWAKGNMDEVLTFADPKS